MLSRDTKLKLFDLVFQFRKTRLQTWSRERCPFAVTLPDGETAYCIVMGPPSGRLRRSGGDLHLA